MLLSNTKNLDIIFTILAYHSLRPDVYEDLKQMPCQLIGCTDSFGFKKAIQVFYTKLDEKEVCRMDTLRIVRYFLEVLSSGLMQNLNGNHIDNIQHAFLKICKTILKGTEKEEKLETKNSFFSFEKKFPKLKNHAERSQPYLPFQYLSVLLGRFKLMKLRQDQSIYVDRNYLAKREYCEHI
ncbi:hypothetical protein HHI36_005681 [Cryptolaemus montrouzieri]|uniref:Uncharacterized protein n=1 Tax=Cryptolaemus montrouzieri TaxID=559131 RepID=A0ABD2NV46_9CUCU